MRDTDKSMTRKVARRRPRVQPRTVAARFKAFAEIASDWWWETDADHRLLCVSDNASRWVDPAPLIGLDAFTAFVNEAPSDASLRETMVRGEPFRDRIVAFRARGGKVVRIAVSGEPQHDAKGRFTGYLGTSREVTALIAAQEALRASDALHRSLADSIDGIVVRVQIGDVWTIEYISPKNEEMFGISSAQMIGLNAKDVWRFGIHPQDLERYRATVEAVVAERGSLEIEYRVREPTGGYRWVLERGHVLSDPTGGPDRLDTLMVDITRQVETRQALEESEHRFESLSRQVDAILYRAQAHEPFQDLYYSPSVERLIGYTPDELTRPNEMMFSEIIHPDDSARVKAVFESVRLGTGVFECEYRIRTKSGELRWIYDRGAAANFDRDGKPRFIDGIMLDITARKATEAKLAQAEARAQAVIENVGELFFTYRIDKSGEPRFVYLSPAFERMTGHTIAEALNDPAFSLADLIHPDDQARIVASTVAQTDRPAENTFRMITKSGETRWVFARGRPAGVDDAGARLVSGFVSDITEMKRLEAEVNARNQYLERLARNLDGSIYRGRVAPFALVSCFGRRPPPLDSIHKADLDRYVREIADACRAMRPYEIEFRIADDEGRERWMLERGMPAEPDAHGIAQFVDCLVIDVTSQRRMREELEVREKLISALATNLEGAMFRVRRGAAPAIEYISPGIKKITGLDADQVIGKAPETLNLRHPDDYAEYLDTVKRALYERRPYESQHRLKLADGTIRWILERGMASAYAEDGSPLVIDGFMFDVTERHRLTEELSTRERQFATLAANIDGVMFRARTGRPAIIEYYSPGIEKQVGIPAGDLIGKPSVGIRLMHTEDRRRYFQTVNAALAARRSYEVEFRMVLPDGRTIWILERGLATEFQPSGEPTIVEGFSIDISARKEAEVAIATARDAAEAGNRAKSEFLAMMTHEIRTPMNGVLGMTSVLLDSGLTPAQERYATTIRESAEGLLRIINDVLDFSKLDAEAMTIEAKAFDLHALFHQAAEILVPKALAKSIAFDVVIDPGVPQFVRADAGRIRQVLLNLAGNAVKFTEAGFVAVQVSAREAEGRHVLSVQVADTGIGIARDRIGRLFQSFEQADASISRRFGGTGLGLAISRKLVERMGGKIGVESENGNGSTFWFDIPFDVAQSDELVVRAIDTAAVDEALAAIRALDHDARVLIVEDNATNRLVATSFLSQYGIAHEVAADGREALAAVQRARYDVVLMDLHMPEMDGFEATRAIRALPGAAARVPIVALTANAFPDDIERCRSVGMDAHLGKPFRKEELLLVLGAAVCGRATFGARDADVVASNEVLDWDAIERFRSDSGEELLRILIDTYLAETAAKLTRLSTLVRSGAAGGEAQRLAHTLKSTSALAGAAAISQCCARIEAQLAAATGVADEDVSALDGLFERYREGLKVRGLAA
ncbi:MAG: PAS domain-containing protein [Alphaproteobacteria bacterium]|nr:PAS domain-containing protein [Alphaproteobacteria bacterium]